MLKFTASALFLAALTAAHADEAPAPQWQPPQESPALREKVDARRAVQARSVAVLQKNIGALVMENARLEAEGEIKAEEAAEAAKAPHPVPSP